VGQNGTMQLVYTNIQGGARPVISWVIIPINYRYNPHKPWLLQLVDQAAGTLPPTCHAWPEDMQEEILQAQPPQAFFVGTAILWVIYGDQQPYIYIHRFHSHHMSPCPSHHHVFDCRWDVTMSRSSTTGLGSSWRLGKCPGFLQRSDFFWVVSYSTYWCVLRREFSGMIHNHK